MAGRQHSLESRRTQHSDRLVGEIGTFDFDRDKLLETVGRAARRTVDGYDHSAEATRMAESVQTAVAGAALMEVSALGLGAIVTALATTQLADITGLLAPAPWRSGAAGAADQAPQGQEGAHRQDPGSRQRLMKSLTEQFEQELERSVHRIRDAVAPYTRFVRAERHGSKRSTASSPPRGTLWSRFRASSISSRTD